MVKLELTLGFARYVSHFDTRLEYLYMPLILFVGLLHASAYVYVMIGLSGYGGMLWNPPAETCGKYSACRRNFLARRATAPG